MLDIKKLLGQRPKDFLILTFGQWQALHECIMAYTQGGLKTTHRDPLLRELSDRGLVRHDGLIWVPTEKGLKHMLKDKSEPVRDRKVS